MYGRAFMNFVIWLALFIVLAPYAITQLGTNLEMGVATFTPYVGVLAFAVIAALAVRMLFSSR